MGFEEDKLNRKKYADFLTEIIMNSKKHKRNSDSKSLSIAIDSSWGTGKSTFINMWKDVLENRKDENGKDEFAVILYNAWKNDFIENPFESLIYSIINHKIFNLENEISGAANAGKKLLKTGVKLGKSFLKYTMTDKFGEGSGEFIDALFDSNLEKFKDVWSYLNNKTTKFDNNFQMHKQYLDTIEELKNVMGEIAQKRKIVIIVDELDRCKPLFAIRLLESIKHIFDIENVSFVFALDMEQLSHSIKCIYGQGMDASGYLCRFFDYISKMPKADTLDYIKALMERKPLIRSSIKNYNYKKEWIENIEFFDIFEDFSRNMNLSLRDIETVYSNFVILENQELKKVDCMKAYSLYLMLLILKYKYINIFNKIFVNYNFDIEGEEILKSYYNEENKYFSSSTLTFLLKKELICNIKYNVRESRDRVEAKIVGCDNNKINYLAASSWGNSMNIDENLNISDCLFYDDIKKWEQIKDKPLVKYIQEKLEFFDFEWENKINDDNNAILEDIM